MVLSFNYLTSGLANGEVLFVKTSISVLIALFLFSFSIYASELKVLTWDGYVMPQEVQAVNKLLKDKGYNVTIKVISPWAEGPEQMYKLLRAQKADISFLTLNYIKMQDSKTARLLQAINIKSPRLSNYQYLSKSLTNIAMGLNKDGKPLYIPWGGGAYGIWVNNEKVKASEVPSSVEDLWLPRWKGKLSLSQGQVQPNIALALLALGKPPFYLNDLAVSREKLNTVISNDHSIQKKVTALYKQVGLFWPNVPEFRDEFSLVASYGPGAVAHNAAGANWSLVNFKEGNTVWLDTINFSVTLTGKRLEAAEIFANYFIGKTVQNRVVEGLGMVAASSEVNKNPLIEANPKFFSDTMFWPPYRKSADNVMNSISGQAMKESGH